MKKQRKEDLAQTFKEFAEGKSVRSFNAAISGLKDK